MGNSFFQPLSMLQQSSSIALAHGFGLTIVDNRIILSIVMKALALAHKAVYFPHRMQMTISHVENRFKNVLNLTYFSNLDCARIHCL